MSLGKPVTQNAPAEFAVDYGQADLLEQCFKFIAAEFRNVIGVRINQVPATLLPNVIEGCAIEIGNFQKDSVELIFDSRQQVSRIIDVLQNVRQNYNVEMISSMGQSISVDEDNVAMCLPPSLDCLFVMIDADTLSCLQLR